LQVHLLIFYPKMKLYVGNLSYQATEQELMDLFSGYGNVQSVNIIKDKFTGRAKGFGFVEMADDSAASQAIQSLHETEFKQRKIIVNEAKPREQGDRPSRPFNRNRNERSDY
jgi:RNA recognition motif-containing protein